MQMHDGRAYTEWEAIKALRQDFDEGRSTNPVTYEVLGRIDYSLLLGVFTDAPEVLK